jgi:HK97 family phage portal protein
MRNPFRNLFATKKDTSTPSHDVAVNLIDVMQANRPLPDLYDIRKYVDEGYRRNSIIFACISIKATSFMAPALVSYLEQADGEKSPLSPDNMLSILLEHPNERDTQTAFFRKWNTHLNVAGNVYALKVRSQAGIPVQLHLLRPDCCRPIPNALGQIVAYEYGIQKGFQSYSTVELESGKDATSSTPQIIPARDILHEIFAPDPIDPYRGVSPIAILARMGDLDNNAMDYLRAFFLNAGIPSGLLKFKTQIDKTEASRVREQWKDRYGLRPNTGTAASGGAFDIAILDADVEYEEIGSKLRTMDLTNIFGETESRICATFGVSPLLVAAFVGMAHSTYSNYEIARKQLYNDTLKPEWIATQDRFSVDLATEFGPGVYCEFDFKDIPEMQRDTTAVKQLAVSAYGAGLITKNEARNALGYEDDTFAGDGDAYKAAAPANPFGAIPPPDQLKDEKPTLTPKDEEAQRVYRRSQLHLIPSHTHANSGSGIWKRLQEIANSGSAATKKNILAAASKVKSGVDISSLRSALENGDVEKGMKAIPWNEFESLELPITAELKSILTKSGKLGSLDLNDKGINYAFNSADPVVTKWLKDQSGELISNITTSSREAIQSILTRGVSKGQTVDKISALIREEIGLHPRYADAVDKYRQLLEDRYEREEIKDSALKAAAEAEKYANKLLRYRADTIARTETIRASNVGIHESWRQAVENGLMDRDEWEREWVASDPCDLCLELDGTRAPLFEPFVDEEGEEYDMPPDPHPNCRCSVALVYVGSGANADEEDQADEGDALQITESFYDPDQPRNEDGEWDDGSGGGSLTKKEAKSYLKTVDEYRHSSTWINDFYRKGKGNRKQAIAFNKSFDELSSETKQDSILYRGGTIEGKFLKEGKIYKDMGFVSTSEKESVARYFVRNKAFLVTETEENALFTLTIPKGTVTANLVKIDKQYKRNKSEYAHQKEHIISRGHRFKITKIERVRSTRKYERDYYAIKATLLPSSKIKSKHNVSAFYEFFASSKDKDDTSRFTDWNSDTLIFEDDEKDSFSDFESFYDPDQPRNEDGEWDDGGGSGKVSKADEAAFKSVDTYRNQSSHINKHFRTDGKKTSPKVLKQAKELDSAYDHFSEKTNQAMTLYRCGEMPISDLGVGKSFIDKGYVSTSTQNSVAKAFLDSADFARSGNTLCMFTIQVPKGNTTLDMNKTYKNLKKDSEHTWQKEHVLPRGTQYKVTKVSKLIWNGDPSLPEYYKVEVSALPKSGKGKHSIINIVESGIESEDFTSSKKDDVSRFTDWNPSTIEWVDEKDSFSDFESFYDPDQPRNEDGEWDDEGGGSKDKELGISHIKDYKVRQAFRSLKDYQEHAYTNVNTFYRKGGKGRLGKDDAKEFDKSYKELKTVLKSEVTVYRGTDPKPPYLKESNLKEGRYFKDKGFISTSASRNAASHFGDILFKITVPKGAQVLNVNKIHKQYRVKSDRRTREKELILQRGRSFKITKVERYSKDTEDRGSIKMVYATLVTLKSKTKHSQVFSEEMFRENPNSDYGRYMDWSDDTLIFEDENLTESDLFEDGIDDGNDNEE